MSTEINCWRALDVSEKKDKHHSGNSLDEADPTFGKGGGWMTVHRHFFSLIPR